MGAESYFVKFVPLGIELERINGINLPVGKTEIHGETLILQIEKHFRSRIKKNNNKYIFDNAIIVNVSTDENGMLTDFTLEGCFSWYREGLEKCYEIARTVNEELINIRICYSKDLHFDLCDQNDFIRRIEEIYLDKYHEFRRMFGEIHVQIPPGHDFYQKIKKQRSSFLKRFLKS